MLCEIRDGVMIELGEVVETQWASEKLCLRLKGTADWQLVEREPELVWHLLLVAAGRELEVTTLGDQKRKFIEAG